MKRTTLLFTFIVTALGTYSLQAAEALMSIQQRRQIATQQLHQAIDANDMPAFQAAVTDANQNAPDEQGLVPLYKICQRERLEMAEFLLTHKGPSFQINALSQNDETALHAVARNGNIDLLALLVTYGADKTRKNVQGLTPAQVAQQAGHHVVATTIKPTSLEGRERLSEAIEEANWNQFRAALEEANLNGQNDHGRTPLYVACRFGTMIHGIMASELLKRQADVNALSQNHETALHAAARRGNKDIVELLIAHGADKNIRNDNGLTAAQIAANEGHSELVALLLPRDPERRRVQLQVDAVRPVPVQNRCQNVQTVRPMNQQLQPLPPSYSHAIAQLGRVLAQPLQQMQPRHPAQQRRSVPVAAQQPDVLPTYEEALHLPARSITAQQDRLPSYQSAVNMR